MASPQALGQGLQGYNFMLTPDANSQMRNIAQQEALAQALQQQSMQPIDQGPQSRMAGRIMSKVGSAEPIAKIVQALAGAYNQQQGNSSFNNLFNPQPPPAPDAPTPPPADGSENPQGPPGFMSLANPGSASMPTVDASQVGVPQQQPQQQPASPFNPAYMSGVQDLMQKTGMSMPAAMGVLSDPSATARMYGSLAPTGEMKNATAAFGPQGMQPAMRQVLTNQMYPGNVAMQNAIGTAAAGQAPVGQLPQGAGGPPMQQQPMPQQPRAQITPPLSGMQVTNDGIMLNSPPPPMSGGMQGIPQVGADALQQPGAGPVAGAPNATTQPPSPNGMTNQQYTAAMDAWKAGQVAQGQKTGDNAAEAAKTFNVMSANLPILQKRIADMSTANKASSFGPWNDEAGEGLASKYQDATDSPASVANARLQQLTAQNILPELGPALAQAGIKGNKFLEQLSSASSGVDLSHGTSARQGQIDGLLNNYIQNMKSTYQQVKTYGGDPGAVFPDPASVANAVKLGIIPRDEGIQILQKNHGMQ